MLGTIQHIENISKFIVRDNLINANNMRLIHSHKVVIWIRDIRDRDCRLTITDDLSRDYISRETRCLFTEGDIWQWWQFIDNTLCSDSVDASRNIESNTILNPNKFKQWLNFTMYVCCLHLWKFFECDCDGNKINEVCNMVVKLIWVCAY